MKIKTISKINILIIIAFFTLLAISGVSHTANAATKLFASGFENGVVLDAPVSGGNCRSALALPCNSSSAYSSIGMWYQNIHGSDINGFNWNGGLPGGKNLTFQYHVCNDKNPNEYVHSNIENAAGRNGTRALYQEFLQNDPNHVCLAPSSWYARNQAFIQATDASYDQLYVRYWIKLQPDFAARNNWRTLMEWRDLGSNRRVKFDITNYGTHWDLVSENFWREDSNSAAPIGNWFLLEVFYKLSMSSDGFIKIAINGSTILDHQGANRTSDSNKPQYHLFKMTSGGSGKRFQHIDDIEIWDNVPCASFPCGAPSVTSTPTPTGSPTPTPTPTPACVPNGCGGGCPANCSGLQDPDCLGTCIDSKCATDTDCSHYYKEYTRSADVVFHDIANSILAFAGGLAFLMFVISGVYMITSSGDPEKMTKGKKIMLYAIIGIIIVLISYAILAAIEKIATI